MWAVDYQPRSTCIVGYAVSFPGMPIYKNVVNGFDFYTNMNKKTTDTSEPDHNGVPVTLLTSEHMVTACVMAHDAQVNQEPTTDYPTLQGYSWANYTDGNLANEQGFPSTGQPIFPAHGTSKGFPLGVNVSTMDGHIEWRNLKQSGVAVFPRAGQDGGCPFFYW